MKNFENKKIIKILEHFHLFLKATLFLLKIQTQEEIKNCITHAKNLKVNMH